MKKKSRLIPCITITVFLFMYTLHSTAQTTTHPGALNWYLNYDDARKDAMANGKVMMLYFSGSDWCKPCIQLDKNILETETFTQYATGNFIPVRLDFPKMKKNKQSKNKIISNENLAEKYNPNGVFPLLVFIDQNEKMIGFTGYSELSPQAYVTVIDKIIHQ